MNVPVDIWLRGDNHATSETLALAAGDPKCWTDDDVGAILVKMLRALERAKNPEVDDERPIALRGFSWIVNPFETGGVVIAIELSLGAVVAGPFEIAESELTGMITRVIAAERAATVAASTRVH